jgi:SAM-dependent methyltransferase
MEYAEAVSTSGSPVDYSNGWEAIAGPFIGLRNSHTGLATLELWSRLLPAGASVLDLGCGFGAPYTGLLLDAGFEVYAIDAAPSLVSEFQRRFPGTAVKCEAAEQSDLFQRSFDAITAIGLLFLLSAEDQKRVLHKAANALNPKGRLLFTAPWQLCEWDDLLTGRRSRSLGREVYVQELAGQGLSLAAEYCDEGENHYFDFTRL